MENQITSFPNIILRWPPFISFRRPLCNQHRMRLPFIQSHSDHHAIDLLIIWCAYALPLEAAYYIWYFDSQQLRQVMQDSCIEKPRIRRRSPTKRDSDVGENQRLHTAQLFLLCHPGPFPTAQVLLLLFSTRERLGRRRMNPGRGILPWHSLG